MINGSRVGLLLRLQRKLWKDGFDRLLASQIFEQQSIIKLNLALFHRRYIQFIHKPKSPMSKKVKKENTCENSKPTQAKKHRKYHNVSNQILKISLNLFSHTLYSFKQKNQDKKIVFYDQFQSQRQDIDGAITSRFLPHQQLDGECLVRCRKVENLASKQQQSRSKSKNGAKTQRKTSQARSSKKGKARSHSRTKDQSMRPKLMGSAYERDS